MQDTYGTSDRDPPRDPPGCERLARVHDVRRAQQMQLFKEVVIISRGDKLEWQCQNKGW